MTEELCGFYPEIEPFETGMLDVGDGHTIYWERVGTRGAKPHGFPAWRSGWWGEPDASPGF